MMEEMESNFIIFFTPLSCEYINSINSKTESIDGLISVDLNNYNHASCLINVQMFFFENIYDFNSSGSCDGLKKNLDVASQ